MIIGIQCACNSGVAVYDKGRIIYAASEERFTNKKNDSSWPEYAIKKAIEVCKITEESIEKVLLASQNITSMHFLCDIGGYSISDYVYEEKEYWGPVLLNGKHLNYLDIFQHKCENTPYRDLLSEVRSNPNDKWPAIWNEWRIKKACETFNISEDKVELVNHEKAHAAYAIYGSDIDSYENVLTVVYDGFGDDGNASIYVHENGHIKQLYSYDNYNIGRLYRYITLLLGMKPDEHEYKVMGLAPYAKEVIYRKPLEVFRKAYRFVDGKVIIDPELKDNYFYFKERLEGMRFDGIAAALQILTEEMNCALVQYWCQQTEKTQVLISGGVALNIKANMEIGRLDCVEDLYVVGSAGDESLCIAAIFEWLDEQGRGKEIQPLNDLYLGDDISGEDVEHLVRSIKNNKKYEIFEDVSVEDIARKLADGWILGRASGRMEFGARALGNRSILANPSNRDTVNKINSKIKSRDFWMPFTPSILAEDADIYLKNDKNFRFPFMSVACETTEIGKEKLQAAIHPADYTARPQLVTNEMNSGYYKLISAFKDLTGVGGVLNTSLNIHGYPIARTAEDAFRVLENSDLDGLILDRYMILKAKN